MAVTFTGTHTNKTYVAGQSYVTGGGRVKVANSDGTFTDVKTGRSTEGSSKDPTVTWGSTGTNSGSGSGAGTGSVTTGPKAGDGAGGGKVVVIGTGKPGAGPGNPGAVVTKATGTGALAGQMLRMPVPAQPKKVTHVFIDGVTLPRNPLTSDAEDIETAYGEGDFGSPTWFMNWVAFGDNMTKGVRDKAGRIPQQAAEAGDVFVQVLTDWPEVRADENLEKGFADFSDAYAGATGGWQ